MDDIENQLGALRHAQRLADDRAHALAEKAHSYPYIVPDKNTPVRVHIGDGRLAYVFVDGVLIRDEANDHWSIATNAVRMRAEEPDTFTEAPKPTSLSLRIRERIALAVISVAAFFERPAR